MFALTLCSNPHGIELSALSGSRGRCMQALGCRAAHHWWRTHAVSMPIVHCARCSSTSPPAAIYRQPPIAAGMRGSAARDSSRQQPRRRAEAADEHSISRDRLPLSCRHTDEAPAESSSTNVGKSCTPCRVCICFLYSLRRIQYLRAELACLYPCGTLPCPRVTGRFQDHTTSSPP